MIATPKASRKRGGTSRRGAASPGLSGTATALAMLALWFLFAPSQVGGWVSYVIVNGNSMEPGFHRGDLVITREEPSGGYEVGDVVAYLQPEIGPVIHRIVDRKDERFILKGDNNAWLDFYQPSEAEMIGAAWVHVPYAGKLLGAMHSPVGILALSLTMGVIAMMSFSTENATKRSGRNPLRGIRPAGGGPSGGPPGRTVKDLEGLASLFGAVLLASLFLGFLAFSRPASVPVSGDAGFRNTGEFGYTANVPTEIYATGRIGSGEPVFRRVTDRIEIQFDYRLSSPLPTDGVSGTYRLDAEVSDVNGWSRTFALRPETPFTGGEFTASGILDLAEIQEVTGTLERETGVSTDRFAVSVVPKVTLGGELGGQPVEDGFSPSLDFWLDDTQLQLQTPAAEGAADASASLDSDEPAENPLSPSEDGSAAGAATEGNTLSVFGFEFGVVPARILALLGVFASAAGLLLSGLPTLKARRSADEPTRIGARHGDTLVCVSVGPASDGTVPVPLDTFEDLMKVAEMAGQKILHHREGRLNDYYVLDSERVYRYQTVSSPSCGAGSFAEPGR